MIEPVSKPLPAIVVLPDLLGKSFSDPASGRVLELWRDHRIEFAVNRWLVVRYLRLLRRLGTSERVIRWWGWWLTSPAKVCYVDDFPDLADPFQQCLEIGRQGGAKAIVHANTWPISHAESKIPWFPASDFIKHFEKAREG